MKDVGEPTLSHHDASDPAQWATQFEHHWQSANSIMSSNRAATTVDFIDTVFRHLEQMAFLLLTEVNASPIPSIGAILDAYFTEEIMSHVLQWCLATPLKHTKLCQVRLLKLYETMVVSTYTAQHSMLVHKPILVPLLHLLDWVNPNASNSAATRSTGGRVDDVEKHFVLLLNQISTKMAENSTLLEFFFDTASSAHNRTALVSTQLTGRRHSAAPTVSGRTPGEAPRFLVFTLMIPYLYEEGDIGQLARDALLLILTVSRRNDKVAKFIAQSDFSAVLATGLSACFSELPRRLNVGDEWCGITPSDIETCRPLYEFHSALAFCNAVVQVCHRSVSQRLASFIYDGFLVLVVTPALFETQLEEMISATAYLELCVRSVTEPPLVRAFVQFLITEKSNEKSLLDVVVGRIGADNRMCQVSLTLFDALLELNCEDLMVELVFKHLLPCTHVMSSQVPNINEVDVYGQCANKLLAMAPKCTPLHKAPQGDGETGESSGDHFSAYLRDAQRRVKACHDATREWAFKWDGCDPDAYEFRGDETPSGSPSKLKRDTLARGSTRKYNVYFTRKHSSCVSVKSTVGDSNTNGVDLSVLGADFLTLADDDLDYVDRLLIEAGEGNDSEASTPRYRKAQHSGFFTLAFDAEVTDTDAEPSRNKRHDTLETGSESESSSSAFVLKGWSEINDRRMFKQLLQSVKPSHTAQARTLSESKSFIDKRYAQLIEEKKLFGQNEEDLSKISDFDEAMDDDRAIVQGDKGMDDDMRMTSPMRLSPVNLPPSTGIPIECGEAMFEPQLGPLLSCLLGKLDAFCDNSLTVNLQLTSVLSRLACYPQPLLRTVFFHPSLVFEPSVRTVTQILAHASAQITMAAEQYSAENDGGMTLDTMLERGWRYLQSRERRQSKRSTLVNPLESMGFTERRRTTSDAHSAGSGDELASGRHPRMFQHQTMQTQAAATQQMKARNLVFCAIILREFVQEMAALSLQHSTLAFS